MRLAVDGALEDGLLLRARQLDERASSHYGAKKIAS